MHIITGLATGGAETVLFKLLENADRKKYDIQVISLTNEGSIGKMIRELGIPVRSFQLSRILLNPFKTLSLIRFIRKSSPDIVQTWMYHADLIGGICARLAGIKKIVWNVRNTNLERSFNKASTLMIVRMCAGLSSRLPVSIISCSQKAIENHVKVGYSPGKFVFIPNGFDTRVFRPDPAARISVHQELGLTQKKKLVGLIARFDKIKDHHTFIRAAKIISDKMPSIAFLLCGDQMNWENEALTAWIAEAGLTKDFLLLDRRSDIPRITAALDVACNSSRDEGFSNVIGEAMACGVICVATDVGDSAYIVDDAGFIVRPNDPVDLALGIQKALTLTRSQRTVLSDRARARVIKHFSIGRFVQRYEELYKQVLSENQR